MIFASISENRGYDGIFPGLTRGIMRSKISTSGEILRSGQSTIHLGKIPCGRSISKSYIDVKKSIMMLSIHIVFYIDRISDAFLMIIRCF